MNRKSLISYGRKTDKAMKTWVQISKTYNRFFTQELKYFSEHDLTFIQFKVLEVLYHRGDLTIGAITKLTLSTPGNITVVVKNLKRDGWITSIVNPDDKRANILSITQKGKDKMQSLFPQHAKNIHDYMDILDEEEIDTLYTLLRKVYKT
ncbi:MarR family winged helix-turn-helix transcriptional regulator [Halarcobacter anaerophilus]|uniref:MarR family transcriptional regulator n=1 Tax=Halarcobacter anaerophilus TaxID=877500 RepID=A0A4Q0Y236_9BACT|nr:MarR family transcriptional regulator [Halarcobacter anaerophilus]QDF27739.1 transcriptional regulator, MarR family [Halarcobacter anaerophilus]RXJ64082.1 MarR family transcriptional regulator [Halarcobacter anaerophilus]